MHLFHIGRLKKSWTNFILRIKEQETCLTLHEHDDDDDDASISCLIGKVHFSVVVVENERKIWLQLNLV